MKIVNNFKLVVKDGSIFLFFILTFNLLLLTCLYSADDNYPTILQEKMKIEKEYEKRISEIIEKIAGPDKAVVSVTVELRLAKQSVSASKSEGKSENTSPFPVRDQNQKYYLGLKKKFLCRDNNREVAVKGKHRVLLKKLNKL